VPMVIYKYLPVFAAERRELGGCYAAERGVCPRVIPPEQEGLTVARNMINGGCGDTGDLLDSAWSAGYRMMIQGNRSPFGLQGRRASVSTRGVPDMLEPCK
jgi:hypothetical protein